MKYILIALFCFISEFGCYKFIKYLDKKERRKLQKWENRYVFSMKPETDRFLEMQNIKKEEKKKKEEKAKEKKK